MRVPASAEPTSLAALELFGVSKRYGSVLALDDVSLVVRPGTIHAVLGENGAGKTTLMRIAYGMVAPDAGVVRVAGRELSHVSPRSAIDAGIGMVHQHFTLVPAMTVQENVALGGRGRLRQNDMTERVHAIAQRTGFALDPFARVDSLPVGAQQRVEIAKALVRDAVVLILDEPTAVLAPPEVDDLLRWLRAYVASGHAVVIITHKLREAREVADDVTVLRHGRLAYTGLSKDISPRELTEAMIGTATADVREVASTPYDDQGEILFAAEHVFIADPEGRVRVRDASFAVRRGELLGVVAVEGSGQRELLRALSGRYDIAGGSLRLPPVVGFVPEDRHQDAVLLDRSVAENVALRGAGSRRGQIDWRTIRTHTAALAQAYDIRGAIADAEFRSLSGGNQQKLVLARELAVTSEEPAPDALVVENPTRGLDVRATADIHARLRDACQRGAAIVVYSSDLDEVLALATRVLVLFEGAVREMPLDRDAIGRAMLGLG